MKNVLLLLILLYIIINEAFGQSRAELEEQRKKTLNEIIYVDNLLKATEKQKSSSISEIKIIGNKLKLRENVIKGMREEIDLVNERIQLNNLALEMMEHDLNYLKSEYAGEIQNAYKSHKGNKEIFFILSAKDFNQGYKRLKYLQQSVKFRREEAEIILELKTQIFDTKKRLQEDFVRFTELKSTEEQQKEFLQKEQNNKQRLVKSLGSKEKQLKKELDEKRRIAKKIESEIQSLIAEERKKVISGEMSPEQKLISDNFSENKGRLPWPVERGVVTSHFGVHENPVLKNVMEKNIGIEIVTSGNGRARSVFKGEVAKVFAINGANMTVILKHGKFLSVYTNLINVKVKAGDKVSVKQDLGEIFYDSKTDNNCTLKFMIFANEYLDPEIWLSKN